MKLKNSFSDETRLLFEWPCECWWCGQSHANSLHHILGRLSDSPLNAAPINNLECHIGNGKLSRYSIKKRFLQKTKQYLLENNYKFTKEDKLFIKKYNKYYDI